MVAEASHHHMAKKICVRNYSPAQRLNRPRRRVFHFDFQTAASTQKSQQPADSQYRQQYPAFTHADTAHMRGCISRRPRHVEERGVQGPHLLRPCRRVTRTYGRLGPGGERTVTQAGSATPESGSSGAPDVGDNGWRRPPSSDDSIQSVRWGRVRTETMMMYRSTGLGVCTYEP
jgi:hypothetical protein